MRVRNRCRLVGEQAQQLRFEVAVVDGFLLPLALEAVLDRVACFEVARIDMTTDAKRVLLAQAALRRRAQPMREEVAVSVAEDDVRDDLLVARVVLDLRARHELMLFANHRLIAVKVIADEAMPGPIREDVLSPDAEDLLPGCPHGVGTAAILTRPRPNTAISSAVRSTSPAPTGRKKIHATRSVAVGVILRPESPLA